MNNGKVWILTGLAALMPFFLSGGVAFAGHTANQIDVCCAWNGQLNDSDGDRVADLTYSISGGGAADRATVRAAVEDWDTAVSGFELNEVPPSDKTANIKVKLTKGGGAIAGLALRKFSGSFITSVDLKITLRNFGRDLDIVAEVTRHEMGHALGLNHADFDDLMDPTVGGATTISNCDKDGVKQANHWKLVDNGLTTPHQPHVTHVGC